MTRWLLALVLLLAPLPLFAQSPASVPLRPYNGTMVDCSATITSGGASQQLLPANPNRRKLIIQNTSSNDIGISFTNSSPTIGGAGTFTLATKLFFPATGPEYIPGNAIYVIGGSTGQQVVCSQG